MCSNKTTDREIRISGFSRVTKQSSLLDFFQRLQNVRLILILLVKSGKSRRLGFPTSAAEGVA